MNLTIHIDGAARGNPGPASFAYILAEHGKPAIEEKGCLGKTTNNVAEYTALVRALERAAQLGAKRLHILSDSELLVKQMNGQYKVKNEGLLPLFLHAKKLTRQFDVVAIQHIPRAKNKRADELCNEALDRSGSSPRSAAFKPKPSAKSRRSPRIEAATEEVILCLQAAAAAWAHGDPNVPPADEVWSQIWSVLEEHGVVHTGRGQV
jgi:ribonuclease HI